ncbi:hypothetical protein D8S78_18320 [Natrialba swarupiae]|nr:hypothetical protein [Natrialba swarupiae]
MRTRSTDLVSASAMPIFPPERRPTVDIVTLGDVSGTTISTARQTLEGTFGIVARRRRGPDPDRVCDPSRRRTPTRNSSRAHPPRCDRGR